MEYEVNGRSQYKVKKYKAEHKRLVIFLPSTGETKEPTEDKKKTTDENKSKKKQSVVDRGYCTR